MGMIGSMTGFGKGQHLHQGRRITIELKSLNQRYFELSCRLPNSLNFMESKIKDCIHKKVKRGRVMLNLSLEGFEDKAKRLQLDENLAKKYQKLLSGLAKKLRLKKDISLKQITSLPDVIIYEPKPKDHAKLWPYIQKALDKALQQLVSSRQREGKFLRRDLEKRAGAIAGFITKIKARLPLSIQHHRSQLKKRIYEISKGEAVLQKERLEIEVAMFVRGTDISEEITRVGAHLNSFKEMLSVGREVGRKLDFTAQELFREVNTIGAKAQDAKIGRWIVEIKEEIEKIREQAQNIE